MFRHHKGVSCESDPYYPERIQIFESIKNEFDDHPPTYNSNSKVFEKKKARWRDIMHKKYKDIKLQLPYYYFESFIQNIDSINKKNASDIEKANMIFDFVKYIQTTQYSSDPFYSFMSLFDFCIYSIIRKQGIDMSDDTFYYFIKRCVDYGYIGISQMRFYMYFTILYSNNYKLFHILYLVSPDIKYKNKKKSNSNQMIQGLLMDALQFAYIQLKVDYVDLIATQYRVPFEDVPQKIIDTVCLKQNLIKKIKNKNLVQKYYTYNNNCQSNNNNNNIDIFYL